MKKRNLSKPKLIYICDALCGWCYGFSPVIEKLHQEYHKTYDFELLPGGMVMENNNGFVQDILSYMKWSYKCIERSTNIRFGKAFLTNSLKDGEAVFDSYRPAIAVAVFRSYQPKNTIQFSTALQKAIYFDGMNPSHLPSYAKIAEAFNIEGREFVECMQSPYHKRLANRNILKARRLKINQFPTIIVKKEGKTNILSEGYISYDLLTQRLEKLESNQYARERQSFGY